MADGALCLGYFLPWALPTANDISALWALAIVFYGEILRLFDYRFIPLLNVQT